MFDTHCHLNFKTFDNNIDHIVADALRDNVNNIVVPGTDIPTSQRAVEIANKYKGVYAAVGIHPHHVFKLLTTSTVTVHSQDFSHIDIRQEISDIEKLLKDPKVVAIGEVGVDRHIYQKTKYEEYKVEQEFIELQKIFLTEQIKLAHKYKKSLILHNREAKRDMLGILTDLSAYITPYTAVFHCCEPDTELLQFAIKYKMFIGVDGDITYRNDKQEFVKKIPKDMLVLETDSPFLSPDKKFPNGPKNIKIINEFIAGIIGETPEKLSEITTRNGKKLFNLID